MIEAATPLIIILVAMGIGGWAWGSQGEQADPLIRFCEIVTSGAVGMIVPRGHRQRPATDYRPPPPRPPARIYQRNVQRPPGHISREIIDHPD